MASGFDQSVADALVGSLLDIFGDAATVQYYPGGDAGAAVAISAALGPERTSEIEEPDGRYIAHRVRCTISAADVATPAENDRIYARSVVWDIEDGTIEGIPGSIWSFTLIRYDTEEKVLSNYRRRL